MRAGDQTMRRIGDSQGTKQAPAYAEVATEFKENIGIEFQIFALVALLALLSPIDHRTILDTQLSQTRQNGFANLLIILFLTRQQNAVECDPTIRAGCAGQFYQPGHALLLVDELVCLWLIFGPGEAGCKLGAQFSWIGAPTLLQGLSIGWASNQTLWSQKILFPEPFIDV